MTDPRVSSSGAYGLNITQSDDPWQLFDGQENADICEFEHGVDEGGFALCKNYSNKAAAACMDPCVPYDPKIRPYENVLVLPRGVPSFPAGSTATFTIILRGV